MNVNDLITHFVAFRRTLGERCETSEHILRRFGRTIGPLTRVAKIRSKDVKAFLAGRGPITNMWHTRYYALKGFFQFAVSRGHMDEIPLPEDLPKCLPKLVPYIYSREEVRRLLDMIPSCRTPARIEAITMRAILLLLYGAGLRRQEVLDLSVKDVDLSNALLTIRDTKFFKSRLVPIGRDLTKLLSDYATWRTVKYPPAGDGSPFFLGQDGAAIPAWTLQRAFEHLRQYAGVRRTDGGRFQPRLHDLRATFAVNRLTTWYRQGKDVQRLVYHLSVYLGHVCLAYTKVYLTMTPELLHEAGKRFEHYTQKGTTP